MPVKSLLFHEDQVLKHPESCNPGRKEVTVTFRKDGRQYNLTMRDKISVEDPYLTLVKAAGFAIEREEPYMGRLVPRSVRDFLIRSSVVI